MINPPQTAADEIAYWRHVTEVEGDNCEILMQEYEKAVQRLVELEAIVGEQKKDEEYLQGKLKKIQKEKVQLYTIIVQVRKERDNL